MAHVGATSMTPSRPQKHSQSRQAFAPTDQDGTSAHGNGPDKEDCDRFHPEEDRSRLANMVTMSPALIRQTVMPFLKEHIPELYAPIGKADNQETSRRKDPNSKYCYRHRPDSKCRKAADEKKMATIQSDLDRLPPADQQAITHVWSLFSAAPSKHRDLMLQGILTQCCFFQLSTVARELQESLKIDFLTALPVELSQNILCFLDSDSLRRAAQVSQRWRLLADSDAVWARMCEQHIDRKCTACGWGLPKLEKKRLREYTRQKQIAMTREHERVEETPPGAEPSQASGPGCSKRDASSQDDPNGGGSDSKRRRTGAWTMPEEDVLHVHEPPQTKPWKFVYRDRWRVGYNWRYGRARTEILNSHSNGVTCVQILENYMATASYDATIKIWDISGETAEEVRTLRGHTRGIRALQFDENKLISGGLDNLIKVWNWHTGECISTMKCHSDGVIGLHFENDYLVSGSADKSVKVFNFKSKETFCLRGHDDWANSVRVHSASRTVISASDDCTIKMWDMDSKRCICTLTGHVGHVQQVLLLPEDFEPDDEILGTATAPPDGQDAASVSSERSSSPVAAASGPHEACREDEVRAMYGPAFASDPSRQLPRRYILTGGLDSTIRLVSGQRQHSRGGHYANEGICSGTQLLVGA